MTETQMQISELNDLKARMLLRVNQKSFMVFGPRNVGKSTLISRFLIDHIFEEKRDLANEHIRKLMIYKKIRFEVEVLDTSSYDPYFTFLPTKHGSGIAGYIIMYDPSAPDSLECVQNIHEKLFQINGKNKPVVLLGNMNTKLRVNPDESISFVVSDDDVRQYAAGNNIPQMSLDVKHCSRQEINSVFNKLVVEIFKEEFKSKRGTPTNISQYL